MTLLKSLCNIAFEAGIPILDVYNLNHIKSHEKVDGSLVTEADFMSNDKILDELNKLTPDIPVVSEESLINNLDFISQEKLWLVDPLDGTKDFINKTAEFTVNISLIERGKPILGVVYAPALGVMYFAEKGCGSYKKNRDGFVTKIQVSQPKRGEVIKIIGSRFHEDEKIKKFTNRLGNSEYKAVGSSLKFCMIADGSAHIYPRFGETMYWDTAASHCIINEAGAKIYNFSGQELEYNSVGYKNSPFVAMCINNNLLKRVLQGFES